MRITFLGTGTSQGVPLIGSKHPVCLSDNPKDKRLRSSILIEKNHKIFLIDCGPDFRYQMLRSHHKKLNAIFITHEHYDHIGGLDDLRPINLKIKKPIPVYGLRRVLENLKKRFYYIFSENKSNTSKISIHELDDDTDFFLVEYFKVFPLSILHGALPILGFRIEDFAYITDASSIPIPTMKKLRGLNVLVLNVLRKVPKHHSHFTLSESLKMVQKIAPKKTYLTHISHLLGFHEDIQKKLPKNVYLAYDGLII
ncbi:MAG: MBL fold metallo-hydrolase [Flavobacteriales bacterium]|jgi:phosphoribosyl 1,2-cyclic phosphate phosphodiesterase|uniref:MBL fold metallo-hydrolase n=1 Tax=Blattabacterium sp. (Mastotermes darwiniensis) TaxID=39768 RepID=UPI000231DF52|nr:MBL fold metallo-hydrolase [Blattabacterium sp. (Mastotermes darwiniensis)]AER40362.1 metal-dependent hydrolase [Blattabacterium sp. (Mastotermes darwiniensis) str. MADAR]MDR1804917.1 MBL fold metallo-hydrolase [Flavobacteriales bacterium]